MSHFYLTLPSNSSMQCHPTNTAAKFTTQLPATIDLDGEWEVGLSEIIYPRTVCNVDDNECNVEVWEGDGRSFHIVSVPKGTYGSVTDVVNALTKQCAKRPHDDKPFTLTYDTSTAKVTLTVGSRKFIKLSAALSFMFGFTKCDFVGPTKYDSELLPDARRGLASMYVYCDVIDPVIVGDTKVQLLRTLPTNNDSEVVAAHAIFVNPIYIPLQKKHFGTIEINIMSDTGDPMPFTLGKSIVVLHFRRSSNPYFLLSR